jgi:hypothetical protein
MDKKKKLFFSKTRTFLSDPKLLNGSVTAAVDWDSEKIYSQDFR